MVPTIDYIIEFFLIFTMGSVRFIPLAASDLRPWSALNSLRPPLFFITTQDCSFHIGSLLIEDSIERIE